MIKRFLVNYAKWDEWGTGLSILCLIHCLVSPIILLSIPILARYYLMHPVVHFILAAGILPVGLVALFSGFRHHRHKVVLWFGLPGLFIISVVPILVHVFRVDLNEPALMLIGSSILVYAHYKNQKACRCHIHKPSSLES